MQNEVHDDGGEFDPEADLQWVRERLRDANETTGDAYARIRDTVNRLQDTQEMLKQQLTASAPEEVRRLRDENDALRSEVAALRAENENLRHERDSSIRQLRTTYQRMRQVMIETKEACIGMNLSDNASGSAQSPSGSSTVRPTPLQPPFRVLPVSRPPSRGPAEAVSTPPPSRRSRFTTPPPSNPNPASTSMLALGAPFELLSSQSAPNSARKFASLPRSHTRIKSGDYGSPMRVPIPSSHASQSSLVASPSAMSDMEGSSSVQYDERLTAAASISASQAGSENAGNVKWRIHFAKAPMNARSASGLILYDKLKKILQFDEETHLSLKRLGADEPDRMRLCISGGYGFVYDPVVLETPPDSTYFVDWGLEQQNGNVEEYIKTKTANHEGLHTFLFTVKANAWVYVGHRRWTVSAALKQVWLMLGVKAQRTLAGRRADAEATEFARKVQSEELQQICVELTSVEGSADELSLLRRLL